MQSVCLTSCSPATLRTSARKMRLQQTPGGSAPFHGSWRENHIGSRITCLQSPDELQFGLALECVLQGEPCSRRRRTVQFGSPIARAVWVPHQLFSIDVETLASCSCASRGRRGPSGKSDPGPGRVNKTSHQPDDHSALTTATTLASSNHCGLSLSNT